MTEDDETRHHRLADRVARFAGALGFNEVRVRWRMLRWLERRRAATERAKDAVTHAGYAHAVCQECARIQPRGTKVCSGCGAPMASRVEQVLTRATASSPIPLSVSMVFAGLILACYARQVAAGGSFMTFDTRTLVGLGAHVPLLEHQGEWWRIGTAIFLHGGLMHLIFNAWALASVGPPIEEIFGRGRMAFFYVATGLAANLPSFLLQWNMIQIGASGAIMGLIGVAAGWGQRDGTTIGLNVRNQMLKWLLFTTAFGFLVRADHSAHVTGFVVGAAMGWLLRPVRMGGGRTRLDAALGIGALAVALALVALVMAAPAWDEVMGP